MASSTSRWERGRHYLRGNWGAAFIIAFMVLLTVSAAQLSLGLNDAANNTAVYAFYSLVLGVVLQTASYIKHGESPQEGTLTVAKPPHPPKHFSRRDKALAISLVAAFATGGIVYVGLPLAVGIVNPVNPCPPMMADLSVVSTNSSGEITVSVAVLPTGGCPPYSFTLHWSDNVTEPSTQIQSTRTFQEGQQIPASVSATVHSSDNQSLSFFAPIPAPHAVKPRG